MQKTAGKKDQKQNYLLKINRNWAQEEADRADGSTLFTHIWIFSFKVAFSACFGFSSKHKCSSRLLKKNRYFEKSTHHGNVKQFSLQCCCPGNETKCSAHDHKLCAVIYLVCMRQWSSAANCANGTFIHVHTLIYSHSFTIFRHRGVRMH